MITMSKLPDAIISITCGMVELTVYILSDEAYKTLRLERDTSWRLRLHGDS